jgi:ParB/RepB/Spo0J family partition protein
MSVRRLAKAVDPASIISEAFQGAIATARTGVYTIPPNYETPFRCPIRLIVPSRWQPRTQFDPAEIAALAESITQHGQIHPVTGFVNEQGHVELIGGERRFRAAKLVGNESMLVQLRTGDAALFEAEVLIDNIQRMQLSPLEEADAFERMHQRGRSDAEIARVTGKGRAYVQQRRMLASASVAVREALAAEKISISAARGLLMVTSDHAAQELTVKKLKPHDTEATARQMARTYLHQLQIERLRSLGWKTDWVDGHNYVWSPADKPRPLSDELFDEISAANQRPGADGELSAIKDWSVETRKLANFFGARIYRTYMPNCPWVLIIRGEDREWWRSDDEAGFVREINESLASVCEGFAWWWWQGSYLVVASHDLHNQPPADARFSMVDSVAALQQLTVANLGEAPVCDLCATPRFPWRIHTCSASAAAPVSAPTSTPVSAPVAMPVAAPVSAPVAMPVAAPVAAPVSAPAAMPVAAAVALTDLPTNGEPLIEQVFRGATVIDIDISWLDRLSDAAIRIIGRALYITGSLDRVRHEVRSNLIRAALEEADAGAEK